MLFDELRALFLFEGLTDDQVRELAERGDDIHFGDSEELFSETGPADFWWVLLEGHIKLFRRMGREESMLAVMDRPGVWAGGFRAWHDQGTYLTTGRGSGTGRAFRISSALLHELTQAWSPFSVHLIEGIFQTVRNMEALTREREALVALGTLAAGLAHEINNPAASAVRAVDALERTCADLVESLTHLAQGSLKAEQFVEIEELRREIDPNDAISETLELADREEALTDWLEDRDVGKAWQIAPALAAAGVEIGWCERVAAIFDEETLGPGLDWVAGTLATTSLLAEVKESTGRVSALVAAVRSYSQMDRAAVQLIGVTEGIESTIVMLGHKLANVTVVRDFHDGDTRIEAIPGELNQVWTNLIDNAIDAMEGTGTLRLTTRTDGDDMFVEVADSGPGMPPQVQAHAFDPFFTTKEVGKGTGLGLDISRRIVVEHHLYG